MFLKCIASGSGGNSYVLENSKEVLILDAGVPLIEVKKVIDFQISKVTGCVISHEHG